MERTKIIFNVGISKSELIPQIKDPMGIFEKFTVIRNKSYRGGYKGKILLSGGLMNKSNLI